MKTIINGYTLERVESYCGRSTPIVEWKVYYPTGQFWGTYQRKKDALEFIQSSTASANAVS